VLLRDFNLYPTVERLTTLERKYGDAINKEDLFGFKEKKKRAKRTNQTSTGEDGATTIRDGTTNRDATTNKDGETTMTKSNSGEEKTEKSRDDSKTVRSGDD